MFNIGGGEFLVIALIALIVLGPQRLPEAARQVGKVMGDLRRLSSGFQNELKGALVVDDDRGPTPVPARDVLAVEPPPVVGPDGPAAKPSPSLAARRAPAANGSRAPRRAPLQAGPVPKAPRPRSKG